MASKSPEHPKDPASHGVFRRATPWHVRWVDGLASSVITTGGVAVILTLLGICLFLLWVVVPLFKEAEIGEPRRLHIAGQTSPEPPLLLDVDEYVNMGALWQRSGPLVSFCANTGATINEVETRSVDGPQLTAFARPGAGGYCALGFDDGSMRLGRIHFTHEFFPQDMAADFGLQQDNDARAVGRDSVASWTPIGEVRVTRLAFDLEAAAMQYEDPSPIRLLDYRVTLTENRISREVLAGLQDNGVLFIATIRRRLNMLTGAVQARPKWQRLPLAPEQRRPDHLLVNDLGNMVVLAWNDGTLWRYQLSETAGPRLVEQLDVTAGDARITALQFLIGSRSLVIGDSDGGVNVWFCGATRAEADEAEAPPDGVALQLAHRLTPHEAAVRALAISPRNRCLVSADRQGTWTLHQATTEQPLLSVAQKDNHVTACRIAPKADALLTLDDQGTLTRWPIYAPHAEATWASMFQPVWYEGYPRPGQTWQSSSGSDDFEPKLGLVPLIFGTFKATFYSMIFAVPIAVLAAIYTSQFVHPRTRNMVKPSIEMMASLPSVVLGFVAALVLAPLVENRLVGVLCMLVVVPTAVWLVGHLWQLLPGYLVARLAGGPRLMCALLLIAGMCLWCLRLGPFVEDRLFAGDAMAWLSGAQGNGTLLWGVLTFPLALWLALRLRRKWATARADPARRPLLPEALVELLGTIAAFAAAGVLSWITSRGMASLGFDLRGELVGTYAQRNTFVVGFVMGFAVIPIIYTIAEDALSAVPAHLKAGSLACGASPWQTTLRVVLPIAGSGIFSAIMIGLGRAVGETMIVVMAAGNTPIMDISPFSGLRALSANIAVELPEAVKDSTLYRVLFLAGLVLFLMTFLINTVAEVVRLHFRKRAVQL